ncbi:MAG: hypothetical protein ACFFB0_14355 [Promethearchaeota archaeon]
MSTIDDKINKKIHLVKYILKDVYEILALLQPLFDRMLEMEESKYYIKNGVFNKAATLFGEISILCKEIEDDSLPLSIFPEDFSFQ